MILKIRPPFKRTVNKNTIEKLLFKQLNNYANRDFLQNTYTRLQTDLPFERAAIVVATADHLRGIVNRYKTEANAYRTSLREMHEMAKRYPGYLGLSSKDVYVYDQIFEN